MRKHSVLRLSFALVVTIVALVAVMAVSVFAEGSSNAGNAAEFKTAIADARTQTDYTIYITDDFAVDLTGSDKADYYVRSPGVTIRAPEGEEHTISINGLFQPVGDGTAHTILGEGLTIDFRGNGRVYLNTGTTLTLDGARIINGAGTTTGGIYGHTGTKIYVKSGEITNCTATTTTAGGSAGAIYSTGNLVEISGGDIHDNIGKGSGGGVGINAAGCTLIMSGGEIYNNTAASSGGGVNIAAGKFEMSGGKIYNNSGTGGGGVRSSTEIVMTGGEIYNNNAKYGGGIYSYSGSGTPTVSISGGSIHDNEATTSNGGAAFIEKGSIEISGEAKLYNNVATSNGGAVSLASGCSFYMSGGELYENEAKGSGGGVAISSSSTAAGDFVMSGGAIRNNKAAGQSGAVAMTGGYVNATITGGEVSYNEAGTHSGAMYLYANFQAPITGIKVIGNTAKGQYVSGSTNMGIGAGAIVFEGSTKSWTLGEGVEIKNNKAETYRGGAIGIASGSLTLQDGAVIEGNETLASAQGHGGAIYMRGGNLTLKDCEIKGNISANRGGAISSAYANAAVITVEEGAVISNNRAATYGGGIAIDYGSFKLLGGEIRENNAGTFGGGVAITYSTDVSATSKVTITGGEIIGNNAGSYGGGLSIRSKGVQGTIDNLQVLGNKAVGSVGGGIYIGGGEGFDYTFGSKVVVAGNATLTSGGGVYAEHAGTNITFNGTTIGGTSRGTADGDTTGEKGNYAAENGGVMRVTAGVIVTFNNANLSYNEAGGAGGVVSTTSDSEVTLNGVTANNNYAKGNGGVANIVAGSTLNINGGSFAGNGTNASGYGVYLAEGAIGNIQGNIDAGGSYFFYVQANTALNKVGELTWTSPIAVSLPKASADGKDILVSGGVEVTEEDVALFKISSVHDGMTASVAFDTDKLVLRLEEIPVIAGDIKNLTQNTEHASLAAAVAAASDGDVLEIQIEEIDLSEQLVINKNNIKITSKEGISVVITGSSFTGSLVNIKADASPATASLILDGDITIDAEGIEGCRPVLVDSSRASFTLENGKLTGGATTGAGVANYGTFTMNGGEICGNNAGTTSGTVNGIGGVQNRYIFIMNGGEIHDNEGRYGGGIYSYNPNDGVVPTVTINGGKIYNNTASGTYGGGISIEKGPLTINGDVEIYGNTAGSHGAGIDSIGSVAGNVTISGNVKIYGNKSTASGGGIYKSGAGVLNIGDGVKIFDNEAGNMAGGVYVATNEGVGTCKIGAAEIYGNTGKEAGGIAITGSTVAELTGTNVLGNTTSAAGVAEVSSTAKVIMDGVKIAGNVGTGTSAGIWKGANAELTIKNSTIGGDEPGTETPDITGTRGNYTTGNAGAVYSQGGIISISDTEINNNVTLKTGGAIYLAKSSVEGTAAIKNVVMSGNKAEKAPGIYVAGEADVSIEGNITADGEAIHLDANGALKKNGELTWSGAIAIAVSEESENGKEILVAGNAEVTDADAQKFELITVIAFNEAAIDYDEESGAVVLKLTEVETAIFTIISANNGEEKEVKVVVEDGSIVLPEQSTLVSDLAGEGYGIENFVGYAIVENFGEENAALTALYRDGAAVAKAVVDGKTVYAVWAKVNTVNAASIKMSTDEDGIRFLGFIETEGLQKVGIKNLTEAEWNQGEAGYRFGIIITKDIDGSSQQQTYYGDGGKLFTDTWYGDELYDSAFADRGENHAFSFALLLKENQYEYEFTPEAFISVKYTGDGDATISGGIPQEASGEILKRSARGVALRFEEWLTSDDNAKKDEEFLGLTEDQITKLAAIAGNTWNGESFE